MTTLSQCLLPKKCHWVRPTGWSISLTRILRRALRTRAATHSRSWRSSRRHSTTRTTTSITESWSLCSPACPASSLPTRTQACSTTRVRQCSLVPWVPLRTCPKSSAMARLQRSSATCMAALIPRTLNWSTQTYSQTWTSLSVSKPTSSKINNPVSPNNRFSRPQTITTNRCLLASLTKAPLWIDFSAEATPTSCQSRVPSEITLNLHITWL